MTKTKLKRAQPANTNHSHHDEHATGQQPASQRSAEPPAIAEESSKTSTDRPIAAADKKPSAASSVAAAASPNSESHSQPEATTATQVGAASRSAMVQLQHQNLHPAVLQQRTVHSKAHLKSSAKELSPPGRAATEQKPSQGHQLRKLQQQMTPQPPRVLPAKHSEVRSAAEDKRSACNRYSQGCCHGCCCQSKALSSHQLVELQ